MIFSQKCPRCDKSISDFSLRKFNPVCAHCGAKLDSNVVVVDLFIYVIFFMLSNGTSFSLFEFHWCLVFYLPIAIFICLAIAHPLIRVRLVVPRNPRGD